MSFDGSTPAEVRGSSTTSAGPAETIDVRTRSHALTSDGIAPEQIIVFAETHGTPRRASTDTSGPVHDMYVPLHDMVPFGDRRSKIRPSHDTYPGQGLSQLTRSETRSKPATITCSETPRFRAE